jgi:hypothetical protein
MSMSRVILVPVMVLDPIVCLGGDRSLPWQPDQPLRCRELRRVRESIVAGPPSLDLRVGPVLVSRL